MIQSLGYIQFTTHRVLVSKDPHSDRIYCFKHTLDNSRCDLGAFDRESEAADYIIEPFPEGFWQFEEGQG